MFWWECRDGLRLALESGQRVGIGRDGLRKDLDRDVAIKLPVPRPVDLPHAPCAQRRDDLIGTETYAGCEAQFLEYMGEAIGP